jgi:ABC-type molybdate transport system substrate-binding protein
MGRHSSDTGRKSLRTPILVIAAVVILVAAGWVFTDRVIFGKSCDDPAVVHVVAAPDVAPAVTEVARDVSARGCDQIEVQSRDSAAEAESLAISDGSKRPDVWIPESTASLQRANSTGAAEVPAAGPSVASSPVVLALTDQAAGELGWPGRSPDWSDVLNESGISIGISDPARDPVGLAALVGVRATAKDVPNAAAAYTAALRKLSPNTTADTADLFTRLPGGATQETPLSAFPASENAVLRHNVKQGGNELVAAYSATPIPALDYPFAVLASAGTSEKDGAQRLLNALSAPAGRTALADAGFRTPEGRTLRDRSLDRRVSALDQPPEPMPSAAPRDELLNQWAVINRSARIRVLIDVSGSMNAQVPGTGKTRMDLTTDATVRALPLFKPTTKIGYWEFSTKLDGDKDYKEIIPTETMADLQANGGADKLRAIRATPDGQTGLYDTVLAAYQQSRAEWEAGRLNLVLVLTDGQNEDDNGISREDLLAQLGKLQDPHRPLQVIGIGLGPDVDPAELNAITGATGGKTFVVPDPSRISDAFYGTLSALACQPSCSGG